MGLRGCKTAPRRDQSRFFSHLVVFFLILSFLYGKVSGFSIKPYAIANADPAFSSGDQISEKTSDTADPDLAEEVRVKDTQVQGAPVKSARRKKSGHRLKFGWTMGSGFDSNPTRLDPCTGQAPVSTVFNTGTFEFSWMNSPGDRDLLNMSYLAGARIHSDHRARGEDVFKHRLEASWTHRFRSSGDLFLLSGLYWESWEKTLGSEVQNLVNSDTTSQQMVSFPELQDYRYSQLRTAYFRRLHRRLSATVSLSAARFKYRPFPSLGFTSVGYAMGLQSKKAFGKTLDTSSLEITADYSMDIHFYPKPEDEDGISRRDVLHTFTFETVYIGAFLAGLGYTLKANISGDSAWSLTRHTITGRAAFNMPFNLVAVLKATYQYLSYPGALLLYAPTSPEPFLHLDEESRSSALVSLQRNLAKNLAVNLVYKAYLGNTPAACGNIYIRHVATVELWGSLPLLN